MTVNNDRIKIIEKVANILAKADSTNFEAEAETARKLAAKLIANYEIKQSELDSDKSPLIIKEIKTDNERRKNMKHALLYNIISKYCGVYMVMSGTTYKLVGREDDIDATIYMMNVIWTQVVSMTESWYAIAKRKYHNVTAKVKNQYKHGLINGVQYNLDKINNGVFQYKQENGLVPVNKNKEDYKNAEQFFTKNNKVKVTNVGVQRGEGYNQGFSDSEKISVRNRVATNNNLSIGWR